MYDETRQGRVSEVYRDDPDTRVQMDVLGR